MLSRFHFYDQSALIQRLCKGLRVRSHEVVFLVGAPLSAPIAPDGRGVPGVEGVIDLIRNEFEDDSSELTILNQQIEEAKEKRYQAAFLFLQGRRGQQAVNDVVRRAVMGARVSRLTCDETTGDIFPATEDECRFLEADLAGWYLNPGTEYLGKLVNRYPSRFGRSILTTNFDPLLEVAIRRTGGGYYRTTLHSDGNLGQTEGIGCHVVHLHGYWYGSDTLHTPGQLLQARPRLRASLASVLRHKIVVVTAYSGWDDAFTEALMDVVRDDSAFPEIIWTFYGSAPSITSSLSDRLQPGIDRGRVNLYAGIDCNQFFPKLYESWIALEPTESTTKPKTPSNPVQVTESLREQIKISIGATTTASR